MAKVQPTKPTKKVVAADDDFVTDDVVSAGSSSYLKLADGKNKVRAISKPITGWIVWEEDPDDADSRIPRRSKIEDGEPEAPSKDPKDKPKKFMTLTVFDYESNEIKIWEITQQSIIKGIKALSSNPDWGTPLGYDLNIEKKGEGKKTRYTVTPSPKKALTKDQIKAANEKPCYLDALYEGEDPFDVEDKEPTEYILR